MGFHVFKLSYCSPRFLSMTDLRPSRSLATLPPVSYSRKSVLQKDHTVCSPNHLFSQRHKKHLLTIPPDVREELIRQNAIESNPGINMTFDVQLIDTTTCLPVPNQYLEFWQANATGVYSGTNNTDNGNGLDPSILNTTFSRAVWPTDADGVVQVDLLFPGHYAPRATHTHVLVHQGAVELANGTLSWGEGAIDFVGQIFFDQDLIDDADAVYPYTTNPNAILPNAQDSFLAEYAPTVDPVAWYVQLGESLEEGIVAWVTIGVDTTASYDVIYAATWTEDGGVENPDAFSPGGGGGGGASGGGGGIGSCGPLGLGC